MRNAYINIGTNKGDRHHNLGVAVASVIKRICGLSGISPDDADISISQIYESEPWGYDSPNLYLNQGVRIAVPGSLSAYDILDALQMAEADISNAPHRHDDGSYADRIIDIDFIALDDVTVTSPRLTLPHPRAHLRDFVMTPLVETMPRTGTSPAASGTAAHGGASTK